MLGFEEIKSILDALELQDRPVIAHASLKPFGYVQNGADTIVPRHAPFLQKCDDAHLHLPDNGHARSGTSQ